MSSTFLNGQLEICHERGVIYFHLNEEKEVMEWSVVTALRICHLPIPIPEIKDRSLDITHMVGCNWKVRS